MADNQENKDKNEHGLNGKKGIKQMVSTLKDKNYIRDYTIDYRIADPQYGDKQFYYQAMIEFSDDEEWLLHSTTTIRDRITEQQWHSENIKRLNSYVKKAYVVVPDSISEKEKKTAESYDRKIQEKRIYSALDGIVQFGQAYQMIEQKGAELMGHFAGKAKLGLHFEEKVVDALNNKDNLEIWKNGNTTKTGYLYELFCKIINATGIRADYLVSVKATSNIPKLPSGGSPKTDVYMEVETLDGKMSFTFSCKKSSEDRVSIHEYTADAFATVLNKDDGELRTLLYEFQDVGGVRAMRDGRAERLEQVLSAYKDQLEKWVLGGIGGEGDPKTQWASHIITVNDKETECNVCSIDEYIIECQQRGIEGQLGTPFQWTYPSGGKGKRIQLKGKMI